MIKFVFKSVIDFLLKMFLNEGNYEVSYKEIKSLYKGERLECGYEVCFSLGEFWVNYSGMEIRNYGDMNVEEFGEGLKLEDLRVGSVR